MRRGRRRRQLRAALAGMARSVTDRVMRWRGRPPELAGVREPRRPKPTLPSAAIALAEPPVRVRPWFRLTSWTGGRNPDRA